MAGHPQPIQTKSHGVLNGLTPSRHGLRSPSSGRGNPVMDGKGQELRTGHNRFRIVTRHVTIRNVTRTNLRLGCAFAVYPRHTACVLS